MNLSDINGTWTLNNGVEMPYFGLGVFKCENNREVIDAIHWALEAGYRHIDTAAIYMNEEGVGKAIKESDIPREDIFVVSKVWNTDNGYEKTIAAFNSTMKRLGLAYLDLYLIHWPVKGMFTETWHAMEALYNSGRVRAIGVSNFLQHHLEELLPATEIIPMVNQLEFHPYLVQQDLLDFCRAHRIQYEAWSPIMRGKVFDIELLKNLAEKYDKSIPQIALRWDLQKGVVTIPKSSKKERIISNADIFNFELSTDDMQLIDLLDRNFRIGPDPDHFNF